MKKNIKKCLSVILTLLVLIPLFVFETTAAITYERKLGVHIEYQFNYKTVRWGSNRSCATSGCGATSASMVVTYFTNNRTQTPDTMFTWCCKNGYYYGSGLGWDAVTKLCSNYGVTLTLNNSQADVTNALKKGNPVIALMGPGTFTSGGHYIVLSGVKIENGTTYVRVNDPNSSSRTNNYYTLSLIWNEKKSSLGICTYSSAPKGVENDFYVEPGKYSKVYSSDGYLNIRASASSSASILGTVPSGTFLKVKSISGSWSAIDYNNISGYVSSSYLKDGGQDVGGQVKLTLSSPTLLGYGANETVSWAKIEGATGYSYTVTYYEGEMSATSAKSLVSSSTTALSFSFKAPSSGKYAVVKVSATGTQAESGSATVMLGSQAAYPAEVRYIPVAELNGGTGASNSTIWTKDKGSAFSAVYWGAYLCSPNSDGTYTVKNAYPGGSSKNVTVSGTDILFVIHDAYQNYEYAKDIKQGDKLTLVGIYLDKKTVQSKAYILVNGGQSLAPSGLTIKDNTVKPEDGCLTGINSGMTVSQAAGIFNEDPKYIKVYNASGSEMTSGLLGTGCAVKLIVDGKEKASYKVAVRGDIDGDGKITSADYVSVKSYFKNARTLSDVCLKAADTYKDGRITVSDYIMMKRLMAA
ncbi:MAG: C39 family peptidase [Clostridia bacterium]|nr:C39 family peptidase [Clostridia bacterium]